MNIGQAWADEMNGKVPTGTYRIALMAEELVKRDKRIAALEEEVERLKDSMSWAEARAQDEAARCRTALHVIADTARAALDAWN